jgi:hypothetical protein
MDGSTAEIREYCLKNAYLHFLHWDSSEDGDSMFLLNAGIYTQVHTVLQPRTPALASTVLPL